MNRADFIIWFKENIGIPKDHGEKFSTYTNRVNYEPLMDDEYSINENTVQYSFEEPEWGYTNYITRLGTFEEFVRAYEEDRLKSFGEDYL